MGRSAVPHVLCLQTNKQSYTWLVRDGSDSFHTSYSHKNNKKQSIKTLIIRNNA